jgi:formimidoylglutamate deiminase
MSSIFARRALTAGGWAKDVRLRIDAGRIAGVEHGAVAAADDEVVPLVIPGLVNAHSHAFQRALTGRAEVRAPAGEDSFWTWRERMYELAARLDAAALAAIAAQAYGEMLASGYTTVAEFHYLAGAAGDDDAMFAALAAAASQSGIRLCYVPVLYERAGFGAAGPDGRQSLFALDLPTFLMRHERTRMRRSARVDVAIGAHSLRAVGEESLRAIAAAAKATQSPLHLHVAEQRREVEDCIAATGCRPVEWLLENFDVDANWCLVHATHMDAAEIATLAGTGAVVCLCPTTEANLGDGLFPLRPFLDAGGTIAIGSDSQVSINPFEELRWLEYGQRLATGARNVVALEHDHVGQELFTRVLAGGARAVGQPPAGLAPGAYADLVVLRDDDPVLVGHGDASLLDALVFSGYPLPVERVMVHGEWCVVEGEHVRREETLAAFARTLARIGAAR